MSPVPLLFGLANQTRVEIVGLLHKEGELSVGEVAEKLELSQANASHHLLILRDSGAVKVERQCARRIYRVSDAIADLVATAKRLSKA